MKRSIWGIIAVILVVCSGCKGSNAAENMSKEEKEEIQMAEPEAEAPKEEAAEEQKDGIYHFYDEAIQEEVESYLEKEAGELTEEDLEDLSSFAYLFVSNPVKHFEDISVLFPDLKYLKISVEDGSEEALYTGLARMDKLRAIKIYADMRLDAEAFKELSYVEVSYGENIYLSSENNLAEFSVLGHSYVTEHVAEPIKKFSRIVEGDMVFELTASDYLDSEEEGFFNRGERKVFVSRNENGVFTNTDVLDFSNIYGDAIGNQMILMDVNFDGEKDILVDNGHFGTQGLVTYTCFLKEGNGYVPCKSFEEISNPSIDPEGQEVLATWRNWAASHSWAKYSYMNGELVETDRLTEELDPDSAQEDEEVWIYIVEQNHGGEMVETNRYRTDELSKEQIRALFFEEDSDWGLLSEKWQTLFNMGAMTDFSIYGSSQLNRTILDIIERED